MELNKEICILLYRNHALETMFWMSLATDLQNMVVPTAVPTLLTVHYSI